jgi:hypothetical protein
MQAMARGPDMRASGGIEDMGYGNLGYNDQITPV